MVGVKWNVAVIGAGPAGLMAAEVLSANAATAVTVYDAMPTAGRKLLMAGKGGLNITHTEPFAQFLGRYGAQSPVLEASLTAFGPQALIAWVEQLGIATFSGSSGRVFPEGMKAAPLLRRWLQRLRASGVQFRMKQRWCGWTPGGQLRFELAGAEVAIAADAVVLALGGGSWPQLGATGQWQAWLADSGVPLAPLMPANCGFDVAWSDFFRQRFAGVPIKPVRAALTPTAAHWHTGELTLSDYGIEGGLVYALSAPLRDCLLGGGEARLYLDLCPDRTLDEVVRLLALPRGKLSLGNFLRKKLALSAAKSALLHEGDAAALQDTPERLGAAIKALPLRLRGTRPLAEAISSAGGVSFVGLDRQFMLRARPGVFCAGEMLDWEAPTGGYLLTACLATGRAAALGALNWLNAGKSA